MAVVIENLNENNILLDFLFLYLVVSLLFSYYCFIYNIFFILLLYS